MDRSGQPTCVSLGPRRRRADPVSQRIDPYPQRTSGIANRLYSILFGEYQCISYGRFDDNEHIVVAINISQDTRHMEIPVWRLGVTQPTRMARVILTDAGGFSIETKVYQVQSGKLILDCPPETAVLVKDIGKLS